MRLNQEFSPKEDEGSITKGCLVVTGLLVVVVSANLVVLGLAVVVVKFVWNL